MPRDGRAHCLETEFGYSLNMRRPIQGVILAAALGSLLGTLGLGMMDGGSGRPDEARFIFVFSSFTMIFTIPGATLLLVMQNSWRELKLPRLAIGAMMTAVGAGAGGLFLGALSNAPLWAAIGAMYGALTALGLALVQLLPPFSPEAAR